MARLHKLVSTFSIVLALTVLCAAATTRHTKTRPLSPNQNKKDLPVYVYLFDPVTSAQYGEQLSKDIENNQLAACDLAYEQSNFNSMESTLSGKSHKCMQVSNSDVKNYFKTHDKEKFSEDFNNDLMKCLGKTKNPEQIMECYVNAITTYLNTIRDSGVDVTAKEKKCVREALQDYTGETTLSATELKKCTANVQGQRKDNANKVFN